MSCAVTLGLIVDALMQITQCIHWELRLGSGQGPGIRYGRYPGSLWKVKRECKCKMCLVEIHIVHTPTGTHSHGPWTPGFTFSLLHLIISLNSKILNATIHVLPWTCTVQQQIIFIILNLMIVSPSIVKTFQCIHIVHHSMHCFLLCQCKNIYLKKSAQNKPHKLCLFSITLLILLPSNLKVNKFH